MALKPVKIILMARRYAFMALADRYPEEYSTLYKEYKAKLTGETRHGCPVCGETTTRTGSTTGRLVCEVHCSKCGHDRKFEDHLDFCSICERDNGPCSMDIIDEMRDD